jgi:hypothetical protein
VAKFRKKPVVIEAAQVTALLASIGSRSTAWPAWANEAFDSGVLQVGNHSVLIKTLEGDHTGDLADWIIRGVKGELYPCKPDIFAATYEAVEE